LRKEGSEGILAANAVAVALEQLKPVSVVDLLTPAYLVLEKCDRDIEETLSSEPTVEIVDRQLDRPAQGALKLLKQGTFTLRLFIDPICQHSEALRLLGLRLDPSGKCYCLAEKRLVEGLGPVLGHWWKPRFGNGGNPVSGSVLFAEYWRTSAQVTLGKNGS
jgi:hypothetical protein